MQYIYIYLSKLNFCQLWLLLLENALHKALKEVPFPLLHMKQSNI